MLADVAAGGSLRDVAETIREQYTALPGGEETAAAIEAALEAAPDGRPETIETLGGGWVAEEALAIALYCALHADSLEHGLRMAVVHTGDSDSTGAIAGNMLGLLYPGEVTDHRWAPQVECGDLIGRMARHIAQA